MRTRAPALIAIIGLIVSVAARVGAMDGADVLAAPALDLLRGLTWPSALVAVMYSPPGRALAGLLVAMTPGRAATEGAQLAGQVREVAEVMAAVSESVRRSSHVQEQIAAALAKIQQSLAILLDRTPR